MQLYLYAYIWDSCGCQLANDLSCHPGAILGFLARSTDHMPAAYFKLSG